MTQQHDVQAKEAAGAAALHFPLIDCLAEQFEGENV